MILIFLGSPGSGKGTQAQIFSLQHHFKHLSTGDLIRREIDNDTKIGMSIRATVESGNYISDEIILKLVEQNLNDDEDFILDGFPRTLNQAKSLNMIVDKSQQTIGAVFNFTIDEQSVINRLAGRYLCAHCGAIYNQFYSPVKVEGICDICQGNNFTSRPDDSVASVKKRLQIFNATNNDVIQFYQQHLNLIDIDANKLSDAIYTNILTQLQSRGLINIH